jgi:GTPase
LATSAQTASYTIGIADAGKLVEMSNASANNLTVPLNATVAYPIGTQINILQTGAGQTTVVATGGVTINATPGLKLRAQWSSATLIKRATDTWVLVGDLSA